jgi:hypothetical protein
MDKKPSRGTCSVSIRGRRWKVKWVSNLGDAVGTCDYDEQTIRIARGQTPEAELDTLIHEIIHAAVYDLDEVAVHATANAVSSVLLKLGFVPKD